MHRALLAMLFLATVACAVPVSISFNYDNTTRYEQGEDYTMRVTVSNNGTVNETLYVTLDTDGTDVLVNKTDSYAYTLTNMSAGASNTRSVTMKINKSAIFNLDKYFEVEVYNDTAWLNEDYLEIRTVTFKSVEISRTYDPNTAAKMTLKITGKNSKDTTTGRWNATYHFYNESGDCFNGTTNKSSNELYPTNCSSGIYDIKVVATADEYTRTATIKDFFLWRRLNFTA